MNFIEAVQWVESELMMDPALRELETADIKRRIQHEHDIIARELRIPTKLIRIDNVTAAFPLPITARDTGLLEAVEEDSGLPVPLFDLTEVADKYPRWREDSFAVKMLVWDPTNITSPVIPKGFDADDALLLTIVVKPTPLVNDLDDLWDGILSEFHDLVPRKTAGDLLLRSPTDSGARAGGMMLAQVQGDMRKAFARVAYPAFFYPGPRKVEFP